MTFREWLDPFLWGLVVGYFAYPVWNIAKKIYSEAKIASEEWNNGKPR